MRRLARWLVPLGVVAIVAGARWVHSLLRSPQGTSLWGYAVMAFVAAIVAYAVGIPEEPQDWQPAVLAAVAASAISTGLMATVRVFAPGILPRFVLLGVAVAVIPWYVLCCHLAQRAHDHERRTERVVAILGTDEATNLQTDADLAFPKPERAFTLLHTMDLGDAGDEGLATTVRGSAATLVVLGAEAQRSDAILMRFARLHVESGVHVRSLELFYEEWFGKFPSTELERMALMSDDSGVRGPPYASVKRVIDVVSGLLMLALLILVTPLVWLGNLVGNRGSLWFRQVRVGRYDEPFTIWKFRTMRRLDSTGPGQQPVGWLEDHEERITRFGGFLRRIHFDELPQAINILAGHLSLVGPRPEQVGYVAELERKLPFYSHRHVVVPGLTGWAQVKYGYGTTTQDALVKLQYDLYYVRHQSLTLDLRILSRTVRQVARGRGR